MQGKIIKSLHLSNNDITLMLDISNLSNGNYIVNIEGKEVKRTESIKFAVQK